MCAIVAAGVFQHNAGLATTCFWIENAPLRLQATTDNGVPDIHPDQAMDYWLSLPEGSAFSLPVRQGVAGLWWQFDSRVLEERLDAFYESKTRH